MFELFVPCSNYLSHVRIICYIFELFVPSFNYFFQVLIIPFMFELFADWPRRCIEASVEYIEQVCATTVCNKYSTIEVFTVDNIAAHLLLCLGTPHTRPFLHARRAIRIANPDPDTMSNCEIFITFHSATETPFRVNALWFLCAVPLCCLARVNAGSKGKGHPTENIAVYIVKRTLQYTEWNNRNS